MQAQKKIWNFSAGPSILPQEILLKAQSELLSWQGCGVSVLEMSHRSKEFESIRKKAEQDLRDLLSIPQNYKVLFLQGGATLEFASIPMNLLRGKKTANYLVSGHWSQKAVEEARKYCEAVEVVKTTKDQKFVSIPAREEWKFDEEGAYFWFCDNETIAGVEFPTLPEVPGQILVGDLSSNFCSRPVDISKYGAIVAGAQKNVGPAGVTIVIVREDLLGTKLSITPTMCDLKLMADNDSLYNTGPTFSIYVCGLYFDYLKRTGGLQAWDELSKKKSGLLYDFIDNSDGFYIAPVQKEYRSRMNIPFRIKNDAALEDKFVKEAQAEGLIELKGHRSVGGCRASFYNGMPIEGVQALVDFMKAFMEKNK